ncbi:MAG: Bug family tripartite tricarboxylate transporter substrate binding protein [Hylemonella sp.]
MAPAINDLRAGHVDVSVVSPATIRPLTVDGRVKVLAIFDTRPSDIMPTIPSIAALGHPKLLVLNWWGICGPSKLPATVITSLRQTLQEVLADPAFLRNLKEKGFEPAVLSCDDFAQFVASDMASWKEVARKSNITLVQ